MPAKLLENYPNYDVSAGGVAAFETALKQSAIRLNFPI